MEVTPTGATLGAVLRDLELATLTDAEFAEVYDAWLEYAVLVFPEQHLSDDEHIAFTRRFGRLERGFRRTMSAGIGRLSNVTKEGEVAAPDSVQARFLVGNTGWHSDSSYKRIGAKASILAAHVVPSTGGETEWADMRAACKALEPEAAASLDGAVAVHSYRFSHAPFGGLEIASGEDLAHLPDVLHPVLRTHPETAQRVLFVGRHASHIVGRDLEESRELLRQLTAEACRPPRLYAHTWSVGDLAIWDNRAVQHYAASDYWPDVRIMERASVVGDRPSA